MSVPAAVVDELKELDVELSQLVLEFNILKDQVARCVSAFDPVDGAVQYDPGMPAALQLEIERVAQETREEMKEERRKDIELKMIRARNLRQQFPATEKMQHLAVIRLPLSSFPQP